MYYFYTASEAEKDTLVTAGWKDEGIAWYARRSRRLRDTVVR